MNEKDTYDFEGKGQLERIEWDDLWYQEADDPNVRRMLLIGDSITRGMRPFANELAAAVGGVADQLATSKSMDHPLLTALVDYAIAQQPSCRVIQVGLTLHGFHQDAAGFEADLDKLICHLERRYPDKKLVLATLVWTRNAAHPEQPADSIDVVEARTAAIRRIADRHRLTVADWYAVTKARILCGPDGVHLTEEGYRALAQCSAALLLPLLEQDEGKEA